MSYKILSKFIKDISFEIPSTKAFVMLEKEILNYGLNFDIKSNPYKNNIIEVNTTLKISPNENVKHKIRLFLADGLLWLFLTGQYHHTFGPMLYLYLKDF